MDPFTLKEIAEATTEPQGEVPDFDITSTDDYENDWEDLLKDLKELNDLNDAIPKFTENIAHKDSEDITDDNPTLTDDLPQEIAEQSQLESPDIIVDDNGLEYKDAEGNLLPDTEYEINGVKYQTDENGRIISWDGKLQDTPENGRDKDAQKEAGGSDRQDGDHGGHLVARMNGGAEGNENMIAMRGHINQSDYKRGENEENQMLKEGKEVNESGKASYDGESSRPSKIEKTYTDGDKTVKASYDNEVGSTDLLENLENVISEEDLNSLKDEISDMQADGNEVSVTSVSNEYDSDGNLSKTTVGVRNETTGEKVFKTYTY
jgi:hypothetical protein